MSIPYKCSFQDDSWKVTIYADSACQGLSSAYQSFTTIFGCDTGCLSVPGNSKSSIYEKITCPMKTMTAMMIGFGSLAGVVAFLVIVILAICLCRRKSRSANRQQAMYEFEQMSGENSFKSRLINKSNNSGNSSSTSSVAVELLQLKQLYDSHSINEREFEQAKARLLAQQ